MKNLLSEVYTWLANREPADWIMATLVLIGVATLGKLVAYIKATRTAQQQAITNAPKARVATKEYKELLQLLSLLGSSAIALIVLQFEVRIAALVAAILCGITGLASYCITLGWKRPTTWLAPIYGLILICSAMPVFTATGWSIVPKVTIILLMVVLVVIAPLNYLDLTIRQLIKQRQRRTAAKL